MKSPIFVVQKAATPKRLGRILLEVHWCHQILSSYIDEDVRHRLKVPVVVVGGGGECLNGDLVIGFGPGQARPSGSTSWILIRDQPG